MALRTWLGPAGLAALVMLFAGAFGPAHPGFREDELQCEEAVAHLAECCTTQPAVSCTYVEGADCSPPVDPDLDVAESRCIRDLPCESIWDNGLCESSRYGADAGPVCG